MDINQMKKIVEGAPDGATHCFDYGDYFKHGDPFALVWDENGSWFASAMCKKDVTHNLTDLREILELRQEVERLKVEAIKLLDAAVCPCCDKTGAYYGNHGELCQCQWCDEVKKLREQGDE